MRHRMCDLYCMYCMTSPRTSQTPKDLFRMKGRANVVRRRQDRRKKGGICLSEPL